MAESSDLADLADAFDYLSVDPSTFPDHGTKLTLHIKSAVDLKRTVLKSDTAGLSLVEFELEEPSGCGKYCSVEDLLDGMHSSLSQTAGFVPAGPASKKFQLLLRRFEEVLRGNDECTLVLDDPLSRSRIDGDNVSTETYTRTWEHNVEFGLTGRYVPDNQLTGDEAKEELRRRISSASRIVALTGAGISTASGIPAFRAESGAVFERYDEAVESFANFRASESKRRQYWDLCNFLYDHIRPAVPNGAHQFFANLHTQGKLRAVITQNIDELHQRSGLPEDKVIQLHGSARAISCIECEDRVDTEATYAAAREDGVPPLCACGGLVKPTTVSFGQALDPAVMAAASAAMDDADLVIIVGTSLAVQPANSLPGRAVTRGIPVIIINLGTTPYDEYATALIAERADDALRTEPAPA